MKTVFDRLVSRRNMTEERISELEDMWIGTKKLREKRLGEKKELTIQQLLGNYIKYNIPMMEHQTEKKEKNNINIWTTNGLEFSQISDHRFRSSENNKLEKCEQNKTKKYSWMYLFKVKKKTKNR